ncbi:MAG TPA: hypothetical protein PKA77_00190 [Chitinophagaceae bacterium]|jgi:antitoxin component YwqK of YwqJK toxin-antitoxin module|nr:hypothetical protein [Chitinophagaceae bacterium]HMU57090.1 hypothetical protein [Chitinophagaceae bacterium]
MLNFFKSAGLFVFLIAPFLASSQIRIGRVDSVKDAAGVVCTYIGEIKNNKPNGRGMLMYPENKDAIRLTGYFVNGLANGPGLLLFSESVTSCRFLNGKPDGKVTFKNNSAFGTETFVKAKSNGKVISVKNDNTISFYSTREGIINGPDLYVSDSGETIYHKRYVNGVQTGSYIQYQVEDNKLFEGYWKNGKWIKQNITFKSLLKDLRFKGFKNDKAQGMGIFNKNNMFIDTGFLIGADGRERYFGLFKDGQFTSGVLINGNLVFVGNLKAGKADGFCSIMQRSVSFYNGNFKDDVLNDSLCTFLNLENGTTYIGNAVNGVFEGKGMSSTASNVLFIGSYRQNNLDGECVKVFPSGYNITANWSKDSLVEVISAADANGNSINFSPQNIEEGILTLASHADQLKVFNLYLRSVKEYQYYRPEDVIENYINESYFKLPGSEYNEVITRLEKNPQLGFSPEQKEYFISTMKSGADSATALRYYEELTGKLKQMQFVIKPGSNPVLLAEKKMPYTSGVACTLFEFPGGAGLSRNVTVQASVLNTSMGKNSYSVVLLIRTGDVQFFK